MTEFKASNGWHIDKAGNVCTPSGVVVITGGESEHVAKFFQELRDHELGRWRDPQNLEFVCYPAGPDFVRVLNETTGQVWTHYRDNLGDTTVEEAAKRFFATHPQYKPLPDTKGLYVNATDAREFPHNTAVLTRDYEGWHLYGDPRMDAESMAQKWHDAGELVRLVPEGGDDE